MDTSVKARLIGLRNRYVFLIDLILVVCSVWGSFALRLEFGAILPTYSQAILWMTFLALAVKPVVYYFFGLYRRLWVYASVNELKTITLAVTVASIIVGLPVWILFSVGVIAGLPRSVIGIDWLLSMFFVGGLRFLFRMLAESNGMAPAGSGVLKRVLVIGAGDAGALVVRELLKNPQMNFRPVGFLDDDPAKQRHQIYDVPVIGTLSGLASVLDSQPVDEVIIAIPSAPGRVVRMVADICRLKGRPFRTMPGIYELIGGKVSVSRLREVDIADLLRRTPVKIQNELVSATLAGKRILVTGAGGSIGRELCRQIARWKPAELVLLGHGENSIFEVALELKEDFPAVPCRPVIADVRDGSRLRDVFEKYQPQVLFHAAAHKHVPLMETNVEEAVTNNIDGTRKVVETAVATGVERLVMISTDKAIHPANVMGATKRLAEMLVLDAARRTGRAYSIVRFGNVLGSRGSVVPLFKQQIARGGPVTVTHPDMRRYFMTIPEAVHLVLQAAAMGQGGEAFLLNMGQQVRILDLAEDLIRLSGLEPGRDIEVTFTGVRPGEKLSEELWEDGTHYEKTSHPDIFRVDKEDGLSDTALQEVVDKLVRLAQGGDTEAILDAFDAVVPGASVRSALPPDITSVI
jgi:FlaA1/EpsC-like NDP-sugar epimerase